MSIYADAYSKHRNLKLAADELGIDWQTLYVQLKKEGVAVTGDKLRYGSDRDKLAATAEAKFKELVPAAVDMNSLEFQSKWDFEIGAIKVDVKCAMPTQRNKKYAAKGWAFSFKKQSLLCDFICCFCMSEGRSVQHVLLVPKEFFAGLQSITVSCEGRSKWLDYSVKPNELASFFAGITSAMQQ